MKSIWVTSTKEYINNFNSVMKTYDEKNFEYIYIQYRMHR